MILQALNDLYERLADDATAHISAPGFAPMGISAVVVLTSDGQLFGNRLDDHRTMVPPRSGKGAAKAFPTDEDAPTVGKRTSSPKPIFLCDKTDYVLGRNLGDEAEKPDAKEKLTHRFELFRDLHQRLRTKVDHPHFDAVCDFLNAWKPERADEIVNLAEFSGANLCFQIQGVVGFVHSLPECRKAWAEYILATPDEDAEKVTALGVCLITGSEASIASVHPAIKGVIDPGGQAEKGIVSFNKPSFCSYGKEQSLNAPISLRGAFQYVTALNWLLAQDKHRVRIGDATTVFWTEKATEAESLFADFLQGNALEEEGEASQDQALATRLRMFMEILRQGGGAELTKLGDDPQTKFFILGLSPNSSRLSVRFWHVATLGQTVDRLKGHYEGLRLRRSSDRDPEFPAVWQILDQTAPRRQGKVDREKIPPLLSGPLMRSILTGSRYPQGLFNAVLCRIRTDHEITFLRACIFKAFLIRNHQLDIPMSLDTTRTEPAYLLGRLFAALEKTQEDALPGINATIRDRFYSAASATPGTVFPRLLRTYQHHLSKLDGGYKVNRERAVQQIMSGLNDMPGHLPLEGQGLFAIGYYHQRQDFFTKKDKTETAQA